MKVKTKTIVPILLCLFLSACGTYSSQLDKEALTSMEKLAETQINTDANTEKIAVMESTSDNERWSDESSYSWDDLDFYPILSEKDIEYKGIPYKDLTKEQFIEMWGQCTRENNLQKMYVLTYGDDEQIKEWMRILDIKAHYGDFQFIYDNPVLTECDDAPEGYYDYADGEDVEEKVYMMTFDNLVYLNGVLDENFSQPQDIRWISLKKVDGYWKIYMMFSTTPPSFFNVDGN